jgi:hypothetical protein
MQCQQQRGEEYKKFNILQTTVLLMTNPHPWLQKYGTVRASPQRTAQKQGSLLNDDLSCLLQSNSVVVFWNRILGQNHDE